METEGDLKQRITKLLKEGGYISGASLSELLGVSRTAIWKQINNLRSAGYEIEASTKKGYRLLKVPDRLYTWEISNSLKTQYIGRNIEYHERIGSTNDRCKELAIKGWPEGGLVIAEQQLSGKGRLGRTWFSTPGENLLFSLLLRPPIIPAQAGNITLLAAVAVTLALRNKYSVDAKIKWPNDVQIAGEKISGILVEMGSDLDRVGYMVVGIGLNVNQRSEKLPPQLLQPACSLADTLGRRIDRVELLAKILELIEQWYERVKFEGFHELIETTRKLSNTIGEWVHINTPQDSYRAKALDITLDGSLMVLTPEGEKKQVYSGEVSLKKDISN